MFSKIILKLIDKSILPVITIISVRFISLLIISEHYKLQYSISQSGILFAKNSDFILANSFSLFTTMLVTFLLSVFSILTSYYFNHNNISPTATSKLFTYKLGFLIQNSFSAYSKIGLWTSLSWLITFYLGIATHFNQVYEYVFLLSFTASIATSVIAFIEVEKTHRVSTENNYLFDSDNSYLEIESNSYD